MRRIVLDTNCLLQAHFNILKQIEWPRLTVIDIKEFTRQLDNI